MEGRVFISYSSRDAALAIKAVEYLEERGYPCWIAPRNITSGHDYTDMINDAISECRAVLIIVSEHSVQSQWVKKELTTAVSYNKAIIPFRISHVTLIGGLQFMLNNVQWIDAMTNPAGHFREIIDGLEHGTLPVEDAVAVKRGKGKVWLIVLPVVVVLTGAVLVLWHPWNSVRAIGVLEADTVVQEQVSAVVPSIHDTIVLREKPITSVRTQEKRVLEEPTVAVVEEPVVQELEVVPEVVPETPKATIDSAAVEHARQAAKVNAYRKKLRQAKNMYIDHKYREALSLFEELRRENPQDNEVNAYISECRRNLAQ